MPLLGICSHELNKKNENLSVYIYICFLSSPSDSLDRYVEVLIQYLTFHLSLLRGFSQGLHQSVVLSYHQHKTDSQVRLSEVHLPFINFDISW